MSKKAVVLLSGGLDSATALAVAVSEGQEVTALHVDYGQRHSRETESAVALARHYCVPLVSARVSMPIAGSALTDTRIAVPTTGVQLDVIPVTYVPARNTFLLGLSASLAEGIQASKIYVGFNAIDYSGYPDCRPSFVSAMNEALQRGMREPCEILAPLIGMSKVEIIRTGLALSVPYALSWSCYVGGHAPCGACDSCRIRGDAFGELGIEDPGAAHA
jgi:7-cyano-7-deazaguanine synthase